ncbi:class III lanthionine synthetase LanKC N-terminal domain-containing protein [Mycoplasma sp. Z386]
MRQIAQKVKFLSNKWEKTNIFPFYYYIVKNQILPDEGWKIHISATLQNYKEILYLASEILKRNLVSFKFIKSLNVFKETLTSKSLNNLTGKFITIYPQDEKTAKKIILVLYEKFKKFSAPLTYTDRQYKKSIIHYRWGSVSKEKKEDYNNIIKKYKPDSIKDLFKITSKIKKDLNGYKLIGLITFDSFSNIWLSEKENKFFIIKESKRHFLNNFNIKIRKNEFFISKKEKKEYFPKSIEYFWNKQSYFFVYEFKKGENFYKLKWKYNLLLPENRNFDESNYICLLKKITDFKKYLENSKLILNDVKLDNFVLNEKTKEISFIDLETSFYTYSKEKIKIKSIYDQNIKNSKEKDLNKLYLMFADFFFDYNKEIDKNLFFSCLLEKNNNYILKKFILEFNKNFNKKIKLKNLHYKTSINKIEKILEFKNTLSFNFEKNNIVFILQFISNFLNDKNFLFNDILLKIKDSKKIMDKDSIEKEIDVWLNSVMTNIDDHLLYNNGQNLSIYLIDGTAGIIFILMYFKVMFNINKYDNFINKICVNINYFFTRKISIGRGFLGIILILFLYNKLFNKKENSLIEEIKFIEFALKNKKIIDFNGKEVDNSFLFGYSGIKFLIYLLKEREE